MSGINDTVPQQELPHPPPTAATQALAASNLRLRLIATVHYDRFEHPGG